MCLFVWMSERKRESEASLILNWFPAILLHREFRPFYYTANGLTSLILNVNFVSNIGLPMYQGVYHTNIVRTTFAKSQ